MKHIILNTTLVTVLSSFALSSHAAVFAKYDGLDGESIASRPSSSQPLKISAEQALATGMLLPAVQSAREAVSSPKKLKGHVETTWKIEKGEK